MQKSERANLAELAANKVVGGAGVEGAGFYGENVRQKFIFLLQVVDHLAANAQMPLLLTDILPGFDLVVMKPERWAPQGDIVFNSQHFSSVDDRVLDLLAVALGDSFLREPGAQVFEAEDGMVYAAFRSAIRAEVLREMGLDSSAIQIADGALASSGGMLQ